jgi:ribosomal protein S4E
MANDQPAQAIEPLRKAYVFADRMLGTDHPETLAAKALCETAREKAALAKLRFRPGDNLKVTAGQHEGRKGTVERLMLNHVHAYVIHPSSDQGEPFMARITV